MAGRRELAVASLRGLVAHKSALLVALLLLLHCGSTSTCLRWNLERALLTESRVQPNPLSMSACSVRWPAAPLAAPGARLRSQEH